LLAAAPSTRFSSPTMALERTILIADDDREVLCGVTEIISGMGFRTRQAETGLQALEIVRHGGIHLALLDHKMPGRTGLEVVSLIRAETLGVPCIVCSGDAGSELEQLVLRAGAFSLLRKPVAPTLLRSEVLRALEHKPPPAPPPA
jgi:CheY-like chemotaxis protein